MVALTVVNPGFETGDLSGWTAFANGTAALAATTTNPKNSGVYSVNTGTISGAASETGLYQDISLPGDAPGGEFSFLAQADHYNSSTERPARLRVTFYDVGDVELTTDFLDFDVFALHGFNSFGPVGVGPVAIPATATKVRIWMSAIRVSSGTPRIAYDDVEASYSPLAGPVVVAHTTQAHAQVAAAELDAPLRATLVHAEVASADLVVPAQSTFVFVEVLRSRQGTKVPVVMGISTGWDPDFPFPSELILNPN